MGDKHESCTRVTLLEDIFSTQDITVAVEFLTVVYGFGADEGFGTDFVWESMYFWTEECQGRLRKLRIFLTVSMVSRLRSSYLTSLT